MSPTELGTRAERAITAGDGTATELPTATKLARLDPLAAAASCASKGPESERVNESTASVMFVKPSVDAQKTKPLDGHARAQ